MLSPVIHQSFTVQYHYDVFFTEDLFATGNQLLASFLKKHNQEHQSQLLFIADSGVTACHPQLREYIEGYLEYHQSGKFAGWMEVPGGELAKNETFWLNRIIEAIDDLHIDRHSYLVAMGGGGVLDLAGYAAAIAHRGVRHLRVPTTVLSQNDSGVGVKNGVNYRGKKNFLGTFAPPLAVFNDYRFITTLSERDRRSGLAEAVKVAIIKDTAFFEWLEKHADELAMGEKNAMQEQIYRCAQLHLAHIGGPDPFERGSSRPLDFGHWSAHKLENLSGFGIRHGEAVAIGMALDTLYAEKTGLLPIEISARIRQLLLHLGFNLWHPALNKSVELLEGLNEFAEHLGGRLTIMLPENLGKGREVHEVNHSVMMACLDQLRESSQSFM